MDTSRTTSSAPTSSTHVTWSDRVVVLRDEPIFGPASERLCERFLGRALSVEGVRSISVNRAQATAVIRHDAGPHGLAGFLERLSQAIRDGVPSESLPAFPKVVREATFTIHRHGLLATTCEVLSDRAGRLRLRHPALRRDPALARVVARCMQPVPGVSGTSVGWWTSSLLIQYSPSLISAPELIRRVESALDNPGGWGAELPQPTETRFGMANVNLGIAAVADFVVPALTPVSAVLLVGTNLSTFQAAWLQIRNRQFGLPVLYTAIASTALASGQFVSCALMSLFYKFWHHRLRFELTSERRRLLDECLPRPSSTCLITPEGAEMLVSVDRLRPGDRVVVEADEVVPADGRVVGGEGIVDERSVRGLEGASRKRVGDAVLAGSTVLAGTLRVEVARLGAGTRASSIVRALVAATNPAAGPISSMPRVKAFADRAVGPALATAGVGLLMGDLSAAGAILTPDYSSGPGVAVPLETLRDTALCARRGIVVHQPDVFERLAKVDLIVIDDDPVLSRVELEVTSIQTRLPESELLRYAASAFRHLADDRATALNAACQSRGVYLLDLPPVDFQQGVTVMYDRWRVRVREDLPRAEPHRDRQGAASEMGALIVEIDGTPVGLIEFGRSNRPEAASALRRIRDRAPVPVALVSNRSEADVAVLAQLLGVDLYKGGFSPDDTGRFLRACRDRGLHTAFVGHCRRRTAAAAEAEVAVSFVSDPDVPSNPAAASLLQPRVSQFADLWEIARNHEGRVLDAQKLVLVPNILCVAGAFLFGFTGLTAVMITNLGTFGLFNRSAGTLRELEPAGRAQLRASRGS
jgi:cation transport ATPase